MSMFLAAISNWIVAPLIIVGVLVVVFAAVFFLRWFIPRVFGKRGKKFVDGMEEFTRNVNPTLAQRHKDRQEEKANKDANRRD